MRTFDSSRFLGLLTTRQLGRSISCSTVVESTNDLALDPERRHLDVEIAGAQRQGRGRHGRSWEAPPETSLLFSVTLVPVAPLEKAPLMTLATAVAVCETLTAYGLGEAHIKWPNDVLIGRDKICGILCEARTQSEGVIRAIDSDSDRVVHSWRADEDWIHSLALRPDGETIASGGATGAVRLWNAADGTRRPGW